MRRATVLESQSLIPVILRGCDLIDFSRPFGAPKLFLFSNALFAKSIKSHSPSGAKDLLFVVSASIFSMKPKLHAASLSEERSDESKDSYLVESLGSRT